MKKSFLKNNLTLLVLSSSLILVGCNSSDIPPVKEEDKIVESVVYDLNTYDLDFLTTDTINFTNGKIKATYTDGSNTYIEITNAMFDSSKVKREKGRHDLSFAVTFVNGYSCSIDVEYLVHDSQSVLDFCKYSRFVPYENELKQTDIDNVITACEYKDKLGAVTVADYFYSYYSKVVNSEKAIVDVYKDAKKEEFLTLFEGMYPNLYNSNDYLSCQSAVTSFVNRSYASPLEIKTYYEDTLKVLQNVTKKEMPLDDYKLFTIDGLRNRFIITFTELKAEGEKGSQTFYFATKTKNFYNDLAYSLEPYFTKIAEANNKQEVDNFNNDAFLGIFEEFKEVLGGEIQTSFILLSNVFAKMDYSTNQAWKDWCAVDPLNRDEFVVNPKAYAGDPLPGETEDQKFDIIGDVSVEYLPPDDGRRFNIEPYRMSTLSEKSPDTVNDATSVSAAQVLYDKLLFEFIQSACEKCLEMHYYYKQTMNYEWDKYMSLYWKYVSSYCGDNVYTKFTYTGVLKEYYGRQYGYDYSTGYRLCSLFYGPSHPNSINQLLNNLITMLGTF